MPSQKEVKRARAVRYALLMCLLLSAPITTHGVFTSVYLSTVSCISEEISLGPCWRKDFLRVKGQQKSQNVTLFEPAQPIRTH